MCPYIEGRVFSAAEVARGAAVCMVNRAFASRYLGAGALSSRLKLGDGPPCQVIGVASDFRAASLLQMPQPMVYVPLATSVRGRFTLLLRTADARGPGEAAILAAIANTAPEVPHAQVRRVDDQISAVAAPRRRWAILASALAAYCLLIAVVGLGAMEASFARRSRRNIGIRLALGATLTRVSAEIVGKFLMPLAAGTILGLAGSLALEKRLAAFLFGTQGSATAIAAGAAAGVLALGSLLLWMTARRACVLSPADALRCD